MSKPQISLNKKNDIIPLLGNVDLKYGEDFRPEVFKYTHLNLAFNKNGELPSSHVCRIEKDISQYWTEKLRDLVCFIQLSGLLWVIGESWWPVEWQRDWSWTLVFNLELIHLLELNTEVIASSVMYLSWTIFVMVAILGVLATNKFLQSHEYADDDFSILQPRQKGITQSVYYKYYFFALEVLYIPACLAVLRSFTCLPEQDATERWFKEVECYSGSHLAALSVAGITSLCFLLHYPFKLYKTTIRCTISRFQAHHEHFLQRREVEYMFGLSPYWHMVCDSLFYVLSSFYNTYTHSSRLFILYISCLISV